jgi:hypothetical protein
MPKFFFQLLDGSGQDAVESEFEFSNLHAARSEAKNALGEMARDGLPNDPANIMSVEIFAAERQPLLEVRLTYNEIRKPRVGGVL